MARSVSATDAAHRRTTSLHRPDCDRFRRRFPRGVAECVTGCCLNRSRTCSPPRRCASNCFGEPGIDGDREVVMLMISSLAAAGLTGLHFDLGHVGVYRALAHGAGIANEEGDLFVAIAAKDVPAVSELCRKLPAVWRNALTALPSLYGPAAEVLAQAGAVL